MKIPKIHIISPSENRSESEEPEIYFHPCEENKISLQSIKDPKALKEMKFQYCLIGYNGKGLFEYLNIFELELFAMLGNFPFIGNGISKKSKKPRIVRFRNKRVFESQRSIRLLTYEV